MDDRLCAISVISHRVRDISKIEFVIITTQPQQVTIEMARTLQSMDDRLYTISVLCSTPSLQITIEMNTPYIYSIYVRTHDIYQKPTPRCQILWMERRGVCDMIETTHSYKCVT